MWIFTPIAFTSIAYSRTDPTVVMFRFRSDDDAQRFRERYLPSTTVKATPDADYHWRIIASEDQFRAFMEAIGNEFTTRAPTNIKKDAAAEGASDDYLEFMKNVWGIGWQRQR